MQTNHLLATAGLAAMLGLGLVACKEETKVYNSGQGDPGSDTRHVDHRTSTQTTKVKGEMDDPQDRDQDKVETKTTTETEVHHD